MQTNFCRIPGVGDVILLKMSNTDLELLARYSRDHPENAFAEIMRRHLDLEPCEANGVELSQCSPYIRDWIDRESAGQGDQ